MNGSFEIKLLLLVISAFIAGAYLFRGFDSFIRKQSGRDNRGRAAREIAEEARLLEEEMKKQAKVRSGMRNTLGEMAKNQPEKIANTLQQWLLNGNGHTA